MRRLVSASCGIKPAQIKTQSENGCTTQKLAMKKHNTKTTPKATQLTIGMDLGDRNHYYCILDSKGKLYKEGTIKNTPEHLQVFFEQYPGSTVAMETGTHSGWVGRLAQKNEMDVLVGHARKLRAIWSSQRKSDEKDAQMLARIARLDRTLLHPVKLRSEQTQRDLALIKARNHVVDSRTATINHLRGILKSFGLPLPSCSTCCFHRKVEIPSELEGALKPLIQQLELITEQIKEYDRKIEAMSQKKYPVVKKLKTASGVGTLTATTFVLTLENHQRFKQSRTVGAFVGLAPRRDQSGESDKQKGISKEGNGYLRELLVGSAQYILGPLIR